MEIMVDIETLGSKENAVIISIGVMAFDLDSDVTVSAKWNVIAESNYDRSINPKTVMWWLQQSKEAQDALVIPEPIGLDDALLNLSKFFELHLTDKGGVWANGATFDISILRNAFNQHSIPIPWQYRQEFCMRSLRHFGKKVGLVYSTYKEGNSNHDALADVEIQVRYVKDVYARLKKA